MTKSKYRAKAYRPTWRTDKYKSQKPRISYYDSASTTQTAMKPEKKYHDISVRLQPTNDATSNAGIKMLNHSTVAGSAFYNRIGNRTQMRYMKINGFLEMLPTSSFARPKWVRLFLVYDKQPKGTLISIGDLLREANASPDYTETELVHINVENHQRFQILMSKRINIRKVGLTPLQVGTDLDQINDWGPVGFSYYVPIANKYSNTTYNSSTGSIADISTGAYYLVAVASATNGTDSVTGHNLHPTIDMQVRMCYYG